MYARTYMFMTSLVAITSTTNVKKNNFLKLNFLITRKNYTKKVITLVSGKEIFN